MKVQKGEGSIEVYNETIKALTLYFFNLLLSEYTSNHADDDPNSDIIEQYEIPDNILGRTLDNFEKIDVLEELPSLDFTFETEYAYLQKIKRRVYYLRNKLLKMKNIKKFSIFTVLSNSNLTFI